MHVRPVMQWQTADHHWYHVSFRNGKDRQVLSPIPRPRRIPHTRMQIQAGEGSGRLS